MTLADRARRVKLAAFDVDGVMTDGTLYIGPAGEAFKPFHVLDGHGVKLLKREGIECAIVSGRSSEAVTWRAKELGIPTVIQGCEDKVAALARIAQAAGHTLDECAYMGDDLPDVELLKRVALSGSVPNAVAEVKAIVHYVTAAPGGQGAVREFCEMLIRLRRQPAGATAVE